MVGRTGEGVPLGTDDVEGAVGLAVAVLLEDDPFAPEDLKNERGGILICFPLLSRVRRSGKGFRIEGPFAQASCSFNVMVVLSYSCVSCLRLRMLRFLCYCLWRQAGSLLWVCRKDEQRDFRRVYLPRRGLYRPREEDRTIDCPAIAKAESLDFDNRSSCGV